MSAPSPWLQLLIAFVAISLTPTVIAILAKIHILPITVYLLVADSFPELIMSHKKVCLVLFITFLVYPALMWGRKLFQLWKEEREAREYLLATAVPLNFEPDTQEPEIEWTYADDDMDW